MAHPKILIQLDPDKQPSSFDAVVALDAGVDQLLQYHLVEPSDVRDLVHGAIFTRGPEALQHTAIFIGGSDVRRANELLTQVAKAFFGPLRVSVLMDANGANTTAAAAVTLAARHIVLSGATAIVLAGTGPVGQRVALLLASSACHVRVASRSHERAAEVCRQVTDQLCPTTGGANVGELVPLVVDSSDDTVAAIDGCQLVVAAGAAGISLLPAEVREANKSLNVVIDLNAVPPLGLEGTEATDKATERHGVICYGAIGVGGTKMKIHRRAIQQLFTANDFVLDAREVFAIGREL